VDGKEMEVTLDDLQKNFALGKGAQKKLAEAAASQKQAQSVLEAFKKDPKKALKEYAGVEFNELAVTSILDEYAAVQELERQKSLSPEQRELELFRKEKADRAEAQKKADAETRTQHVAEAKETITNAAIQTLKALPEHFPRNEFVAARAIDLWATIVERGPELRAKGIKISPQIVADMLKKELRSMSGAVAESADDTELDAVVPEAVRKRIIAKMKADAEKAAHPANVQEPKVRESKTKAEEKPRITRAQMLQNLRTGK